VNTRDELPGTRFPIPIPFLATGLPGPVAGTVEAACAPARATGAPVNEIQDPQRPGAFPLTLLEMDGSFPLTTEAIDQELTRTSPGNYALGYMDAGAFVVFYVGRSDCDVKRRLQEWVGTPSHFEAFAPSGRASWGLHRGGALPLEGPALASVASADSSYTRFAYSYAPSPEAAYAKEWCNYDDFGGSRRLDNEADPISSDTR